MALSRLFDWFRGRPPGEQVALIGFGAAAAGAGGRELEPDHGYEPTEVAYEPSDLGSLHDFGSGGGFDGGGSAF